MKLTSAAVLLLGLLALPGKLPATAGPLAGESTAVGPIRSIGPEGYVDLLRGLVFPDPADPRLLLALSPYELWLSRDAGASWRSATAHLPYSGPLDKLQVDPFDPTHWILLARGENLSTPWNTLVETRDGGRTFSRRPLPVPQISLVLFDRAFPGRLLSNGVNGLYRSLDGGATWDGVTPPSIFPTSHRGSLLGSHGGRFYLGFERQLWSLDVAARSWEKLAETAHPLREVQGDLFRPDALFARSLTQILKSTDGGRTFTLALERPTDSFFRFLQSPANGNQLAVLASTRLYLSPDRGASWSEEPAALRNFFDAAATFDTGGDLLWSENEVLLRRFANGDRAETRPRGLYAISLADVFLDMPRNRLYVLSQDGTIFRREADLRWTLVGRADCSPPQTVAVKPWNPDHLFVACFFSYLTSRDGGLSFVASSFTGGDGSLPNRILFGPEEETYLLRPLHGLQSLDDPSRRLDDGALTDAAIDPDPARGVLATRIEQPPGGELIAWRPDGSQELLHGFTGLDGFWTLAQDLADADHLFALGNGGHASVSFDRGVTWDERGTIPVPESLRSFSRPAIDPADPDHLLAGGQSSVVAESRDGGESWGVHPEFGYNQAILVDGASTVYAATLDGLRARAAAFEPCAGNASNFCARQGRFELTVEWQTPSGLTGVARKIETGNDESGLFYFFSATNWELLVKVLDGCALNQRFWVFTAGTTDVDYLLKVEDRWTGKIRSYWNRPGQAAEAVTDTDAFATCSEPAPAGAAAPAAIRPAAAQLPPAIAGQAIAGQAQPALELHGGRFRVEADWTDFAGLEGQGTPAPLLSSSSGLFWFFSPDNWEVLIKVLDGCAINDRYWVLAAATTDVGYELRVTEPQSGLGRTYRNPVGRASPAQIDLEAFPCD